ncbi:hypothetical protein PJ311_09400 [Bacillus sp. CLL-7-23]|uniref:Protein TolB n=1 Tax=Bacillus changyiensis TaxID=3004103 RepID=A0ABT4X3I7_9BACI|nr:hypothetical protein [Bacillus changyiensis]MDA7026821.1 hypothetical protein [Bacillus changyiensis]
MKKRMIYLFVAVVLIAGGIVAVRFFDSKHSEPEKSSQSSGTDLLVAITDQKLMTSYYENQDILYKEKMTGYPGMALDQKDRLLYYTNTDNNVKRLIRLNLKSSEKTTLYSGEMDIDELSLSKDRSTIFLRRIPSDRENFQLASFNLKKKTFSSIYPEAKNKDENVSFYRYNREKNQFVLLHFSMKEDRLKTDEANEKGILPEPTNMRISLADQKGIQHIKTVAKYMNDIGISPDGKTAVFTETIDDGKKTVITMMDISKKTYRTVISDQKAFTLIDSALPQFSKDGKKIYFLAEAKDAKVIKDKEENEAKVRTIYSYDRDTKTVKKEWEKPDGIINSFKVLN